MKDLKEALITKKNIKNAINPNDSSNRYNITKNDLTGELKRFPLGVVVRMLEEQEKQGNDADIEVFKELCDAESKEGGFDWDETEAGMRFWSAVIIHCEFDKFYERYPDYKQYDI